MISDPAIRKERISSPIHRRYPSDSYVDPDAQIGEGARIGHFVSVHRGVKVGDDARIEDGAKIYESCEIGLKSIIGANAVLRPHTRLGDHTIFGTLSCAEGLSNIGNSTTIHAQCHITQHVTIGDNVFIAPFFIATNTPSITQGRHGSAKSEMPALKHTVIEEGVRMGASVRMTPGLTVGAFSLIDQDTLITKNIPPHSHVRGGKDKIGVVIGQV